MATKTTQMYIEVEQQLGAPLDEYVDGLRAKGLSWRRIARQLEHDTGTDLTPETLRVWFTLRRQVA